MVWAIRGHQNAIHYLVSHVSNEITEKVRQEDCAQNHLHFHNVLIKANLLHWFGDWKSRVNKKRGSSLCVYFNVEGTAYVCEPLMTVIFSIHVRCTEMIKGKMCTVVVVVILAIRRKQKDVKARESLVFLFLTLFLHLYSS